MPCYNCYSEWNIDVSTGITRYKKVGTWQKTQTGNMLVTITEAGEVTKYFLKDTHEVFKIICMDM
jgi:hypothetical protein